MQWEKKEIAQELVKEIAASYGCDLLTASVLARRGITAPGDVCYYLETGKRYLHNPFMLPGMEDAVDRILAAKEEGEKVLVFGDRDVDGITSTTLVTQYLRSIGMDVSWRIPTGDEPYGLSIQAVEDFAAAYGTLIITVDCGVSNMEEIRRAGELGIDVVVTDHHNPREELPEAHCVVNPKLTTSEYPFRDLAGCGVAYKLVSALRFAQKSDVYGQSICLLNTRPVNDAWVVEVMKMRNLAAVGAVTETVIPGAVSIQDTRLPSFLQGQQILCWEGEQQRKVLAKLFGRGVEISMLDISEEIGKEIPAAAGKSLLRLAEESAIAKYSEKETGELDVFASLFTSFIQRKAAVSEEEEGPDLQLVAVGTVADIMPLKDENRILVRRGINALVKRPREGLSELLFKLDMAGRRLSAEDLSWQLCPALNSAGRMGRPEQAASLLMEEDKVKRDALADELLKMNEDRKKMGAEAWALAAPAAREKLPDFSEKLAVVWGESIPRGVTGIIASRLAEYYGVPGMVVSFGEETVTGSLRSARGYDLRFLLEPHSSLFIDWGGHDYAAGFSMTRGNWDIFIEKMKTASLSIELGSDEEQPLMVDAELPPPYLKPEILKLVDRLAPYGSGNPPLLFMTRGIKVTDLNLVGNGAKHVKFTVSAGSYKWPALYWKASEKVKREFDEGDTADILYEVSRNYYRGYEIPQLVIKDLKRTEAGSAS